jgi:hypothetical protein
MIVFVVIAIVAAAGIAYKTWSSQQLHIVNDRPFAPKGSALKLQMMKGAQSGGMGVQ